MKWLNRYLVFPLMALPVMLMGCENIDSLESGDGDVSAKAKTAETLCDFGSPAITVGTVYSVVVQNKNLKTGKPYLVEVKLDDELQSPTGEVKTSGRMLVSVQPWAEGSGSLSAYETKSKKGVVQKTLIAQCSFVVKETSPIDQCPDDPDKTVPGLCGCGVADLDSDQDGAPDCQDACPMDPSKLALGECGCGVPEGACGEDVDTQGEGCREGVIDDARGGADNRPACSQLYPWPSGQIDNYRERCSLCSASTDVPYNPFDPDDEVAWTNFASRSIGSPPTTCANALLGATSLLRTSQQCSDFRATYGGVCCGRETACSYVAVWYTDSPDLSCDDAPASGRCRCADDLTAPARPEQEITFPVSDFSALSPFAEAVRSGDLCGVEIGTSQFQTGQFETTCARLYEAARRGFTQKYECGLLKNMLRDRCGSLNATP